MAILIPASFGGFTVTSRAQVKLRVSASSNQRTVRRDSADWVKETASFFEEDKRPIMLFDGYLRLSVVDFWHQNPKLFYTHLKGYTFDSYYYCPSVIGVCNLCNGGVKFVKDHDRNRSIRFEALQSEAGRKLLMRSGRAPDDISSVVLVEKDRSYIKSEAVLKIMNYIDLPFPQLAFFIQFSPLFVRDFLYENVANNRYAMFGRSDSCEI